MTDIDNDHVYDCECAHCAALDVLEAAEARVREVEAERDEEKRRSDQIFDALTAAEARFIDREARLRKVTTERDEARKTISDHAFDAWERLRAERDEAVAAFKDASRLRSEIQRARIAAEAREKALREALERLEAERDALARERDDLAEVIDKNWVTHQRIAAAEAREKALTLALRNVRALALRLRKTDPTNAAHFLRFCAEAGVEGVLLRAAALAPPAAEVPKPRHQTVQQANAERIAEAVDTEQQPLLSLVWRPREDCLWNADCPCGTTLAGYARGSRYAAEVEHAVRAHYEPPLAPPAAEVPKPRDLTPTEAAEHMEIVNAAFSEPAAEVVTCGAWMMEDGVDYVCDRHPAHGGPHQHHASDLVLVEWQRAGRCHAFREGDRCYLDANHDGSHVFGAAPLTAEPCGVLSRTLGPCDLPKGHLGPTRHQSAGDVFHAPPATALPSDVKTR